MSFLGSGVGRQLDNASEGRIPSLDGARAIAIALVMASHVAWKSSPWLDYGNLGVRVFFVISGFLITKLLLDEQERSGRISIAQFYLRRAFRILPAAYLYIAIVFTLLALGRHVTYKDVIPVMFYYANYQGSYVSLGHFWSLAVEEQFYLLWPAALAVLGAGRARYACVALLITAPLFRALSLLGVWPTPPMSAFESVSDALATGCLLAMMREVLWKSVLYRAVVKSRIALAIAATGLLLTCADFPVMVRFIIGIPLLNFGIAVVLDRYMRVPGERVIGRMLNVAPVVWLGTISYSLYLWQQPWMFSGLPIVAKVGGAIYCAVASFYLVERPIMRLRGRAIGKLLRGQALRGDVGIVKVARRYACACEVDGRVGSSRR